MQCPSCKEPIDDDSRFCDQCGKQIMVCSLCKQPGTGKRCTRDGKEMIAAGSQPAAPAAMQTSVQQAATIIAPPSAAPTAAPMQSPPPSPPAGGDVVKFSGNGIVFEAKDGDVVGRKAGPFAGTFAGQQAVSGTHCKIVKVSGAWHIQDLGSTNGTFVQGNRLAPNVPCPLQNNGALKIATIDFISTFAADDDGATIRV
jgi:predicted component of type VI protein secretion system